MKKKRCPRCGQVEVNAVESGRLGGLTRAKNLTKAERTKQARHAALVRWGKK